VVATTAACRVSPPFGRGHRSSFYGDEKAVYSEADVEAPEELAAFDPDGMGSWTAVILESAQDGDTYFTAGSDVGRGAVTLGLTDGLTTPTPP